jgi:hypothetical protein
VQAHEEQYHPRRRRVSFSLSKDDANSMRPEKRSSGVWFAPSQCFLSSRRGSLLVSKPWSFLTSAEGRSSRSNKSCRRRLAQEANGSPSRCVRPCSLHSFFFQRLPSSIARACSWFHDPRPHLHQPMPVPGQLPQITIFRARYPHAWKVIFQQQL